MRCFAELRVMFACLAAFVPMALSAANSDHARQNANSKAIRLPTGQIITPTAAAGAIFEGLNPHLADFPQHAASHAVTAALSPDRRTLLILTSGFNVVNDVNGKKIRGESNEYVFVWDVSGSRPVQRQVIPVANTFVGMAFAPDDNEFYVAGGMDDNVHTYRRQGTQWAEQDEPIKLNHSGGNSIKTAIAAGLAVTADGQRLLIANFHNDSISIVDLRERRVSSEFDLRPGKTAEAQTGAPGGEYPYWVAIKGNRLAYISSIRDREIVVLDIEALAPRVVSRIPIEGNPNKMILNRDGSLLFVACDNSDAVAVIDTATNRVRSSIRTAAPARYLAGGQYYRGSSPNGLMLSDDEKRLYVSNGGGNSVAVVALDHPGYRVIGLVPTGWYPNDVAVDGRRLYVINGKSIAGPNPGHCLERSDQCLANASVKRAPNSYVLSLQEAGFLSLPVPQARELDRLTRRVAANNAVLYRGDGRDDRIMQALRQRIHHVIYIIKENRTYDQILGDLPKGNGDPSLVEFGRDITPNHHALATRFVTLDNFFASGEVSGNGWPWSTSAREADIGVKTIPTSYAGRGLGYDVEGTNRGINVALETVKERRAANPESPADPDLLPGKNNLAAPDGPDGEKQEGYLWDAALRAGLTVRNYGFLCDLARYGMKHPQHIPLDRTPFATRTIVAYPANPSLMGATDPYFRCYDNAFPDFYREHEWEREFSLAEQDNNLPALSLVRLPRDHTGSFGDAIDGVNTPETQVADNDYAVGKLIEAVAQSRYKDDTLIFVVEDDAQDGPDHVDAQRTVALVAGPYVKQGAIVSKRYSTVNMLRTVEDVLGIDHLSIHDAHQGPLADIFDLTAKEWSYKAVASRVLLTTALPIADADKPAGPARASTQDARYWEEKTAGLDFSVEDKIDALAYNKILWAGLSPGVPYPEKRTHADLRHNRERLLEKFFVAPH